MANGGDYAWTLEPDAKGLRGASDDKAWMDEHYDAIHVLCSKAQQLLEEGYKAPVSLISELSEYGLRYAPGMAPCIDSQRGVYAGVEVTSADGMLDLHRNHELRRQGRLGDDEWLGAISYAAWNFMTKADGADNAFPMDMIMRSTGLATTSMTINKSASEDGWHGQAGDHPQNARVRLRMYGTPGQTIRYVSKAPTTGTIVLQTEGPLAESVIDGLAGMSLEKLVDDPILNGAGLRIRAASQSGGGLTMTIDEQGQHWHPVVFPTCQRLEGIKIIALREYRQATA